MYGVIVCPRCRRAKGVDLKQKTTACACGFEIRVVPARIRGRAATARELAPLVGQVNAELAGGAKEVQRALASARKPRPREVHARVIAAIPSRGDRSSRIRAAAVELTNELELFTRDDWTRVLEGLGLPDAEVALAVLLDANVVFEPKPGFYRAVDLRR
ncbi:MAG TPA: DUF1922 domain-containing protein [Thermoplasmata archaeon]|nr:DUF1922 domain-containing protein [Thermoplasmata archaeon]